MKYMPSLRDAFKALSKDLARRGANLNHDYGRGAGDAHMNHAARIDAILAERPAFQWTSMDTPPDGAGGQVWVAYRNPNHPNGWNLRVQWTPVMAEHAVEPLWWRPVERPGYPILCDGCRVRGPWEHRCHGNMARVDDEPAGGPCVCPECAPRSGQ